MNKIFISRENNFDIIRLLAALQVFVGHGIEHLQLTKYFSGILSYLGVFPGVLVFFVISGFLITRSFDGYREGDSGYIIRYVRKRILRIFPALWCAFLLLLALLLLLRKVEWADFCNMHFIGWIGGQLSIFQYYTPSLLRDFGVGTPNGSLWTIPIELEFYILVPFIFIYLKKYSLNLKMIVLLSFSILVNVWWTKTGQSGLGAKMFGVSLFPYLYAFLFGGLVYLNWHKVRNFIEGKFGYWLVLYCLFCWIFKIFPSYKIDTYSILIINILLGILTLSAVFTMPKLGGVLKGNDISYGVYIYHMIVINVFVELGLVGSLSYLLYAFIITIILSLFSWKYLEKKFLMLKYK